MKATRVLSVRLEVSPSGPFRVPSGDDVSPAQLDRLADSVAQGSVLCVTGAGCSTESGIPDYRSPHGSYSLGYKPMTHMDFMKRDAQRSRYWARSYVTWPAFQLRRPNECHKGVAALQEMGLVSSVITQNVDGLHGTEGIVDLHGRLDKVVCMDCGTESSRNVWQADLATYNPTVAVDETMELNRSDGDSEIGKELERSFRVPPCRACASLMTKPHVVLFGDTVPKLRVEHCHSLVERSSSVLVLGTSLEVYSSWRFVKAAVALGRPVNIVNIGSTRADDLATEKVAARVGSVLPRLHEVLRARLAEGGGGPSSSGGAQCLAVEQQHAASA